MLVIFSSSILFSRSISVYLSEQLDDSTFQLTFEHLSFLGLGAEMAVVLGRDSRLDSGACILQLFLVDQKLFILPFLLQNFRRRGLCSEHAL